MRRRPPQREHPRLQVEQALQRIQRECDRPPQQAHEQHVQEPWRTAARPPAPQRVEREQQRRHVGQPQPTVGVRQLQRQVGHRQRPDRGQQPHRPPGHVARHHVAGEEREHAVRHREIDRQQQAERAELDRHEHPPRRAAEQERTKAQHARQAEEHRGQARTRVPGLTAFRPQQAREDPHARAPAGNGHEQAYDQRHLQAQRAQQHRRLPTEHAHAHRHVAPARDVGQSQPAREHGQQEAEEEAGQHLVLHDEGMQPAGEGGRLRQLQQAGPALRGEPRGPPRHGQQQVAGADEEHQPVRGHGQQAGRRSGRGSGHGRHGGERRRCCP